MKSTKELLRRAKVLVHKLSRIKADIEFLHDNLYFQQNEDSYDAADHWARQFDDVIAEAKCLCFGASRGIEHIKKAVWDKLEEACERHEQTDLEECSDVEFIYGEMTAFQFVKRLFDAESVEECDQLIENYGKERNESKD